MRRRDFIRNSIGACSATVLLGGCSSRMDTEFIILGGGISGLYLGLLLQDEGKDFMVLEGSPRIGGRLYKHPVINREVGGRGIGDKYVEVMKLVERFGIELIDITPYMNNPRSIYYNNTLHPSWEDRTTNPSLLEFTQKGDVTLEALDEWHKHPDWDIPYAEYLMRNGTSEEALDIINIATNYNDVYSTSVMNSLHSRAFRKFNGSKIIYNFKSGSSALIEAMADSYSDRIHTDKFVQQIVSSDDYVEVKCEDNTTYRAKTVISTLPFSTLRRVDIDAPLGENQKRAISELGYTNITQIHLNATEKYWEEDDTALSMWTDTPIERIMDMNPSPNKAEIVCWVNGKGTAFFDNMTDKEIADYTIKTINKIRPASEGKLEYVGTHSWGNYKYNKGAYAEFLAGQTKLFTDMIRPAGRIHFAGEHTAHFSRGIEGAAESAVRVFKELTV